MHRCPMTIVVPVDSSVANNLHSTQTLPGMVVLAVTNSVLCSNENALLLLQHVAKLLLLVFFISVLFIVYSQF